MRSAIAIALVAACRFGFNDVQDGATIDVRHDTPVDAPRTYREVVLADGPIGYWRLGDAGSIARDETGQHDGTYAGVCAHVAGALVQDADTATHLDGASCEIKIADAFGFTGTASFTIEAWLLIPNTPASFQHVWSHQSRDAGNLPFDGYSFVNAAPGIKLERTVGGANVGTPAAPITFAAFHHIVATYDGTTQSVYVDGTLASAIGDATALQPISFTALIGATVSPSPGYGYLLGTLDEVAIYDRALTPERIAAHHKLGTDGPGL